MEQWLGVKYLQEADCQPDTEVIEGGGLAGLPQGSNEPSGTLNTHTVCVTSQKPPFLFYVVVVLK